MSRRRLTQQQRARIESIQERRRAKLAERAEQSLSDASETPSQEGRVVIRHGATLGVADENGQVFQCLIRQNIGHPVCGDRVVWQPVDDHNGVVTALQPRASVLSRPDYGGREKPLAANITQLVVVLAPEPKPSGYLLDQYLIAAETIGIRPLIAINKIDLLENEEKQRFLSAYDLYRRIGYELVEVSAKLAHGLNSLIQHLAGETSILVGQSGVGKSSLINALLPNLEIETGRLSEASGLGRHTTSAATCYNLQEGGELIDSPGVRSFRLTKLSRGQLEQGFPEFRPFLGHCRFNNCSHQHEPGCAIRQAVETGEVSSQRLDNFLHLAQSTTSRQG